MTILQKHLVFIPLGIVCFIALFGSIVMLLWNWLMPDLFGLPHISFWQSAGLLMLCKILFGGLDICGHHGGHGAYHHPHNRLRNKWESLTPEERELLAKVHSATNNEHTDAADNGKK